MTNMRGVFYPTGHMVLMFPTEAGRRKGGRAVAAGRAVGRRPVRGHAGRIRARDHRSCDDVDDMLLPSMGTEADTAQRFRQLAHEGHHALIVHASAKVTSDHVLELLKDTHISYGQRYRFLVIEDMVC